MSGNESEKRMGMGTGVEMRVRRMGMGTGVGMRVRREWEQEWE